MKFFTDELVAVAVLSLSSRRAWIEISLGFRVRINNNVALLTEGVD